MKTKPHSSWADAMARLNKSRQDKIPVGWKSGEALAKEFGLSRSSTRAKVSAMLKAGLVERKSFFVVIDGVRRWIPHYKPL